MIHTKEEYIKEFNHMEDEEKNHGPISGMAWDSVALWWHDAVNVDKVFIESELEEMYPTLFGWNK